jgi:hypothetical protein
MWNTCAMSRVFLEALMPSGFGLLIVKRADHRLL